MNSAVHQVDASSLRLICVDEAGLQGCADDRGVAATLRQGVDVVRGRCHRHGLVAWLVPDERSVEARGLYGVLAGVADDVVGRPDERRRGARGGGEEQRDERMSIPRACENISREFYMQ